MTPKEHAIEFAQQYGLAVIPLEPGTKKPLERGWADLGRRTASEIDAMPEGNYGVLTNGITVVDFDPRNMEVNEDDPNDVAYLIDLIRRTYGLDTTLEIATGSGGVHLYYEGATRPGKLEKGVDIKSGPGSQVVGPGSLHVLTGKPYHIWNNADRMVYVPDLISPQHRGSADRDWDRETTHELKEGGIVEGERNEGLYKYLCRQRRLGQDDKTIQMLGHIVNKTEVKPPLPQEEVETIIRQALQFEPGTAALESILVDEKLVEAARTGPETEGNVQGWVSDEQLNLLPDPVFLVEDMVPETGIMHLVGQSYAGKSFVAIDLVRSLAQGKEEWFGKKIREGGARCAYVALEGEWDLKLRMQAWDIEHGPVPSDRMRWFVRDEFDFMNPTAVEALTELRDDIGFHFEVLVVDTQSLSASSIDENDNSQVTALMSRLKLISRIFGCLVVLVHHAGHGEGKRERGASAMYANMDAAMLVSSNSGRNPRSLKMRKLKAGALIDDMSFALVESGPSVVIEHTTPQETLQEEYPDLFEWTPAQARILDIIKGNTDYQRASYVKDVALAADVTDRTVKRALAVFVEAEQVHSIERPGGATEWWAVQDDRYDKDAVYGESYM